MDELDVDILASAEKLREGLRAIDGPVAAADAAEGHGEPPAAGPFAGPDRLLDKLADGEQEGLHLLGMRRHEVLHGPVAPREFAEGRIFMRIRQTAAVEDEAFDILRHPVPEGEAPDDDRHVRGGS